MGEYNIENFPPISGIWLNAESTPIDMTTGFNLVISQSTPGISNAVSITDSQSNQLLLKVNGTDVFIPTIDMNIVKTNEGTVYEYIFNVTVSNLLYYNYVAVVGFLTGNKITHLKPRVYFNETNIYTNTGTFISLASITSELLISPASITLGSPANPVNLNLNSSNISSNLFYPSASTPIGGKPTGTIIIPSGASTSLGLTYDPTYELILKLNTTYAFLYTPDVNGTNVFSGYFAARYTWYEE